MATLDDSSAPFAPPSAEEERALLEKRARALARRPEGVEAAPELSLVELRVGDKRYALEQRFVRRVIRRPPITPLPSTRTELLGMVAYAGRVLPCFDLALLLGGESADDTTTSPHPKLLVLGVNDDELGLAVDEIIGASAARASELASAPDTSAAGLLLGVLPDALHVLDGERLLADPRLRLSPQRADAPSS